MARGTEILERLHTRREQIVEFLRTLTLAESPSDDASSQSAVRAVLADALRELGFRSIEVPGQTSGGQLYASPAARHRTTPLQLSSSRGTGGEGGGGLGLGEITGMSGGGGGGGSGAGPHMDSMSS